MQAKFKELMSRTGYSEADLRDRFYDHMSGRIKDELVHTARPIGTLEELIEVAIDLDVRIRQRDAEKARRPAATTMPAAPPPVPRPSAPSIAPFAPPARDPNAMEVDATKSRLDWIRAMTGKCYGCGSTQHTKANGGHEREICGHCTRAGHREAVCFDKWAGKPKARRVAASESVPAAVPESPSSPAAGPSATPSIEDMLAQLTLLSTQFAALQQSF
ncbi:hypothetical protein MPER_13073 [Moniliophthora perniciosa FA553]|nr:hypothetical protein MPER_13073 [Moniliophthora perniciosa FA553]